jgi:antirestriction protein
MTIKEKFSSIDQSKLTADQKSFLDKIKNVTKNFTDAEMNKKVEQPLDNFIAKAKEKMPEAIKSAPVKATPKSKAKPSQTRKPKRTAMSLAKEIRKEGETWKDAQERARKMMKEDSKDLSKTVESELDKLSKLVRSQKERQKLSGLSGTNIKRDASRKAKPKGRRISKEGNVYYENRDNRTDRLAPNYPKNSPFLEQGGGVGMKYIVEGDKVLNTHTNMYVDYDFRTKKNAEDFANHRNSLFKKFGKDFAEGGYLTDPTFGNFQNQVFEDGGDIDAFTLRMVKSNGMQPAEVIKEDTNVRYKRGGSVTTERRYVNKDEDYEVRYSKPILRRKGYQGKRDFELGGTVVTDLAGHTGGGDGGLNAGMPLSGVSGTQYTGLVGETGAMSSGEMFMAGGTLPSGAEQSYMITESFGNPAQHFAKGGGVRKVGNREYSYGRNWTNDHRHVNKGEEHEVNYTRKGKFLGIFKEGGAIKNQYAGKSADDVWKDWSYDQKYHFLSDHREKIGFEEDLYNESKRTTKQKKSSMGTDVGFMYIDIDKIINTKYTELPKYVKFALLDHVRTGQYNKGGAVTNERKHVNHDEDYEVRYAKPRPSRKGYKGARKFMAGGSMETPRIYVADLEAYNNGRLVGEWLDLADYNDADELMDAIQDVLKKSGGEEYAIHDVEYVPRSMYSEYMGRRDFEELYEMMDLAKQNDLPLEVVQEIVSQYDASAVEDFVGKYDSAEDFAQQMVDDLGIESFTDFQYYLEVSETDRRLLSQEMADSYVDDIKDEDGGNRIIEEAGMDVEEYEEADDEAQEEMLDKAREIVYDEYYDNFYEGLSDPYYFLVEEQGLYDAESFSNANFVRVDFEKLGDALEQDYTFIENDGDLYVFNIR